MKAKNGHIKKKSSDLKKKKKTTKRWTVPHLVTNFHEQGTKNKKKS